MANPIEPSVRTYVRWSVARLRMAEAMADRGDLRYAAEFCDALFGDDRASAVLQTRAMALLGLTPTFEASLAGDGRKRSRAARAIEAEEDWWTIAPTPTLAAVMKWGIVLGLGLCSKRWVERKGRDLPTMAVWHPSLVRYDDTTQRWTTTTRDGEETIAGAAGRGTLNRWALFLPYGPHRPWMHGMWRGAARWWLLKQYAIDDWGRHSETAATKVASRRIDPGMIEGSTKEARRELANDIYQAGKDAVIVLPDGFDLKLVEATANTRDIYEAQVNAANLAFGIQALGHNLTSEVSGAGSFAAGKIGDSVRQDYRRFDNDVVGAFAHDEVLGDWAGHNFGDRELALWPTYPVEPPRNQQVEATTLSQVAQAISTLQNASAPIDVRALLERFDVPLLSDPKA